MHGRADLSTAPIHTEKALEDGAEPNLFHSPRLLQARYRECLHANRREVTFNAKYFVDADPVTILTEMSYCLRRQIETRLFISKQVLELLHALRSFQGTSAWLSAMIVINPGSFVISE